jgi:hypothetical protein
MKRDFSFADLSMEGAAFINDLVEILSEYDGYQKVLPEEQLISYQNRAYFVASKLLDFGYDVKHNIAFDLRLEENWRISD